MNFSNIAPTKRQRSFLGTAAWISLVTPPLTFGLVAAIQYLSEHTSLLPHHSRQFNGQLNGWALLIDLGSFILGVLSFSGIRTHGAAFILWKAVPGVILSAIFGFCHFVLMMMSSIIC